MHNIFNDNVFYNCKYKYRKRTKLSYFKESERLSCKISSSRQKKNTITKNILNIVIRIKEYKGIYRGYIKISEIIPGITSKTIYM